MSLKIVPTPEFSKQTKKLSKEYKNLVNDLKKLQELLIQNPLSGTSLGNGCYKIRLANSSIPTGKSGGFRVITYCIDKNDTLRLLLIYSKTERSTITDKELYDVLKNNGLA
ncbi:MAG: hypothetical protein ACOCP1_01940 [Campylobacterales bacterium]